MGVSMVVSTTTIDLRLVRRITSTLVAVLLFLTAVSHLIAVEPGRPSKTSVMTMAARAIGSHEPDPTVRNPDWLAERFLGPDERAQIPDNPLVLGVDQDYREAMKDPRIRALVIILIERTRFIDDHLLQAVRDGATQVVNLGAGFDTRAYRFRQELRSTKVFEVDYGPTQEYKKRRVREVIGAPPQNLVYVPIDFTRQNLGEVLRKAGYRRNQKTFFIWEGVTMYLPEDAVLATLRFVATDSVPGSSIVFDHYTKSFIDGLRLRTADQAQLAREAERQAADEPFVFGIPDGTEQTFVSGAGLELVEHLAGPSPEAIQRYLTRRDGTLVGGDVVLPRPTQGAGADRFGYWLARATVPAAGPARSR
jgi:methyltransferase (TIGR00027 family)